MRYQVHICNRILVKTRRCRRNKALKRCRFCRRTAHGGGRVVGGCCCVVLSRLPSLELACVGPQARIAVERWSSSLDCRPLACWWCCCCCCQPPKEPTYLVKHTGTIDPKDLAEEMKTEMADVEEDFLEMVSRRRGRRRRRRRCCIYVMSLFSRRKLRHRVDSPLPAAFGDGGFVVTIHFLSRSLSVQCPSRLAVDVACRTLLAVGQPIPGK